MDRLRVRRMRPGDGRTFLDIHARSVRGLAAHDYSPDIIDAWAGRVTDDSVRAVERQSDDEIRLFAELDGQAVGLGVLVVSQSQLRACYVSPEAARQGVGSAIVKEIERIASDHGVKTLNLSSSINAEPFYTALGYTVVERGEHTLRSGLRMAAVMMQKRL